MPISEFEIYGLVKELSAKNGFADFGCAAAEELPIEVQQHFLSAMKEGNFASMDYLGHNIEKRFNPTLLVEGARSVMVFLAPYSLPHHLRPIEGIAQYALGDDYHKVIKDKLFAIMGHLKEICPQFQGRAFTDSAPILEREWGVRAGLGWIGKNNFLISKSCGIKNLIGIIISNLEIPSTLEIEPEKKRENCGSCGECTRCIANCPSGALGKPYNTDSRLCISYHSIENRNLPEEMENGIVPAFHGKFFGCDNCLDACPWNSANKEGWEEFRSNYGILSGRDKEWWMNMDEEEFKRIFKNSPVLRGGLKNIKAALVWGKKGQNG